MADVVEKQLILSVADKSTELNILQRCLTIDIKSLSSQLTFNPAASFLRK